MPKPFSPPGAKTHYAPDRPALVSHVRLEVEIDLARKTVAGTSTLSMEARRDALAAVELDAVDLEIRAVAVDGAPAAFHDDGQRLRVELGQARARGVKFTVSVDYTARPRRGLYFLAPDEGDPARPTQCWTQGQDEDSRHWWPCVDAPTEKATSEVVCTAQGGVFVLSNGDLVERRDVAGGRVRWHYAMSKPHAPYLVTLVCGTFAEIRDSAPETGVEVYAYVPPGREDDGRRTFGRTARMIDFFSRRIGLPYPHRRYSQIAVADFIFGGMENTTATTITSEALLDQRAALDHDMDALVSHELAHQWWGNLLTCREWPEAWLNEGFATYFEYVWREHARGRDEADFELLGDADSYLAEADRYQRPIVCRQYEEPIELFDSHLYEKGGRVLHMLRHELGDEVFWRALEMYARRHAFGNVETRDLARALEEASGRNFDGFFAEWVGSPGHPELEAAWEWDADKKVGSLRLDQKQGQKAPADQKHDGGRCYQFALRVRFEVGGSEQDRLVAVQQRSHVFEFRLDARPTQVVVDPGDVLLKSIKQEKARGLWTRQLEAASLAIDRVLAARALGERPDPAAVAALATALARDAFWGVRAAAAVALGKTRRDDALEALLAARGQEHPRVRRAVASALGEYRGSERAAEALAAWLGEGDASYFVEATAALALGRTRSPRALDVLPALMGRRSFQDVIRTRAIEGLGASGDERAIALVQAEARPQASFQSRRAIAAAVARLAEGTRAARAARDFLESCLGDRDFRVRMEAASGLVLLGDVRATPALDRALRAELDGRARRRLREAITDLRESGRAPEKLRKMEEELDKLRGESGRLRERMDRLEGRAAADSPAAKSSVAAVAHAGAPVARGSKAAARGKRPRRGRRR